MKLAQSTRLQSDKGRGNRLADGEVGGVDAAELTSGASDLLWLMLKGAVDVGGGGIHVLIGKVNDIAVADGSVEDVGELLREVVEDRLVNAKVLGENITGRVGKPVIDVEGGADAVEVAVIKDKEELVVIIQTTGRYPVSYKRIGGGVNLGLPLDSVGDALWEVPDISVVQDGGFINAVLIHSRDKDAASIDEPPFGLGVTLISIVTDTMLGRVLLTTRCQ